MGLRERNAAHTRELITGTALSLFVEQGYDATTMEEIAEGAEVSTSTLYRYFPSKDLLVIGPFELRGQMAAELQSRPVDEPLALALGHALTALLTTPRPGTDRIRQLRMVLDSNAGLRARALEEFVRERMLLEQAIAERTGRAVDDVFCQMTARQTMAVLEIVGMRDFADVPEDNASAAREILEFMRGLLGALESDPPVVPQLAPDA
ncbi:TetR/AcrR family transcriptional regulator [Cellulomonas sp. PhB150]|uniref:TetR/AcrR family transcriptional regulator n=1 Tax=Cellulomonas sp. PhB150 TaxID=2485188 RepID=UPI000F47B8B7|nr:TetR/AcrR family transcriptional regulator [Cellulomonas sp. PhB150]ROS23991.1 TetR family transcriptional regulator [Cellulomonas sp. PhB150]